MTVPVLRVRAVLLRPVEDRDHPLILAWQNQPEVWWWMDGERTVMSITRTEFDSRHRP